jgi:hypothetical protein
MQFRTKDFYIAHLAIVSLALNLPEFAHAIIAQHLSNPIVITYTIIIVTTSISIGL